MKSIARPRSQPRNHGEMRIDPAKEIPSQGEEWPWADADDWDVHENGDGPDLEAAFDDDEADPEPGDFWWDGGEKDEG